MGVIFGYILGPFVSLLPQRCREVLVGQSSAQLIPGAIISGAIEAILSAICLVAWFMGDLGVHWDRHTTFLFTLIAVYLGFEGALRAYLALTAREVHGTFLLSAAEYFTLLVMRPAPRPQLPLIPDEIAVGDGSGDLKIASCREKRDWKYPHAIRYEGAFFRVVASQDVRNGPRPYIYSLRPLRVGEIAGGLKDYDPQDVLKTRTVTRVDW